MMYRKGMRHISDDGATRPEFVRWMTVLAETLGARLTESRIRAYAHQLDDIELADLMRCGDRWINEGSAFFPQVADVRRLLGPSVDDAALLQWAALNTAAGDVGYWTSLEVEDPAAAHALVTVFGSWPGFCEQAGPDNPAMGQRRQEFVAAYREGRRIIAGAGPQQPVLLAGSLGPPDPKRNELVGRVAVSGIIGMARPMPQLTQGSTDGHAPGLALRQAEAQGQEEAEAAQALPSAPVKGKGQGKASRGGGDR